MLITDLIYIDDAGYHFADYPSFETWIKDQYRAIYGADVYLEADSQDGQLLAVFAKALYDTAAVGASVYNSFSPVTAQGLGLSRNVKINGLTRRVATNSTVDITIVGVVGTTITGGVVQDTLNQKWDVPTTTIPIAGEITVTATAQELGSINAEPNSVTKIFTPTLGWQTVNNAAAATPGEPVETDAELRVRQAESTANPSLTVFDGTVGGVGNLAGVTNVRGYENDTSITDADGLPPHSISLVVAGGDSEEIAQEIALHKTPGTETYGDVTETVYDSHGMPLDINFYRPVTATISVEVSLTAGVGWTTDYEDLIKAAVAAQAVIGGIGNTVYLTRFYAPANLAGTAPGATFAVSAIRLKKNAGAFGTSNVSLTFKEIPVCDAAVDVTLIVS